MDALRARAGLLPRRLIGTPEQPALFDGSEHVTVPVAFEGAFASNARRRFW